ncbi:MAG TPA: DUF421 domain-containing protein [Firmicutes bacterium]|nr:DUF421 domain-containing protein [Bacillota bacterium]
MDPNCYIVIYRTILFYLVLLLVFKMMGKREIGQLTLLDLVVSVLMAEIAAMAIDTLSRPVHEVLIAIGLLGALQFSSAFLTMRFKKIREVVDGKPSIFIYKGIVNVDEMRRQRYTFDDLMLQLRANNISSIYEVEYAILESNGQLSSFKKGDCTYCPLPIITSGGLEKCNLKLINKSEEWVAKQLESQGISGVQAVYYAAYDGKSLKCITRKSLEEDEKKANFC